MVVRNTSEKGIATSTVKGKEVKLSTRVSDTKYVFIWQILFLYEIVRELH